MFPGRRRQSRGSFQGRSIVKAVESSTVVAFRALVMLACLVVAPLAAIFGSTFPELVKTWLVHPILAQLHFESPAATPGGRADSNSTPTPAIVYSSDAAHANSPANNAADIAGTSSPGSLPGGSAGFWQAPAMIPSSGAAAAPATTGLVAAPDVPNGPVSAYSTMAPGAATSGGGFFPQAPKSGAMQAGFSTPVESTPLTATPPLGAPPTSGAAADPFAARASGPGPSAGATASPPASAAGESEQFAWFEKKLRDYGAAYYLLETWGNEGELYRFHCKMAIGGNPNYTRHFEATDRDKLQAMAKVLAQIEAWRGVRHP